jgi:hypothetical protein
MMREEQNMSTDGWLPPGVTDADIDRAAQPHDPDALPCRWEKVSGVCMICGAGIDDECEVERERDLQHQGR